MEFIVSAVIKLLSSESQEGIFSSSIVFSVSLKAFTLFYLVTVIFIHDMSDSELCEYELCGIFVCWKADWNCCYLDLCVFTLLLIDCVSFGQDSPPFVNLIYELFHGYFVRKYL